MFEQSTYALTSRPSSTSSTTLPRSSLRMLVGVGKEKQRGSGGVLRRVKFVASVAFLCSILLFMLLGFHGFLARARGSSRRVATPTPTPTPSSPSSLAQCNLICAVNDTPCQNGASTCSVASHYSSFLTSNTNASASAEDQYVIAIRIESSSRRYCALTSSSTYLNWFTGKVREMSLYNIVEYYADGSLIDEPFAYNPGEDHIDRNIQKAFNTTSLAKLERPSVLILGLGCGRSAHVLKELLSRASVDFVEIDEAVIYAAKNWFCLPERENFNYIQDDAFDYVLNLPANKVYDYIMLDVFKGKTLPQKFKEEAYFRMLRDHVSDFGLVSMNVSPGTLVEEEGLDRKAKAVFPHVDVDYFVGNAFMHMRKQYQM